jgi:hypothetical protein
MIDENDKALTFRHMADVMDAPNGLLLHWKDYWWIHHPEKGLVFLQRRGLAHVEAHVVQGWIKGRYDWAELKFMPDVFVKAKISEIEHNL